MGSAGGMPQPDTRLQLDDYESAMGGMTWDSVSSTRMGEPNIKTMGKNPEVEAQEDRVNEE